MQTDFDQWFKREPEGAEKKTARDRVYFTGREMNILMANARWKENQKRRFRKFIETSGISRMRVKDQDESVSWRYVGAELTNWAGHVVATYAGTSSGDED
jgi:hypothetical protein